MIFFVWLFLLVGAFFVGVFVWTGLTVTMLLFSEAIYRKIYHHYYPCEEGQCPVDLNPDYTFFIMFLFAGIVGVPLSDMLTHLTIRWT